MSTPPPDPVAGSGSPIGSGSPAGKSASAGKAEPSDDAAPTVVVFDVGEVIIDETRIWATWADILGVSPLSFAAVLGAAIVQGLDYDAAFEELAPNVDWPEFVDDHERRYGGFRPEDVYPDVRPCMEELRAQGVAVVVAGNQPARRTAQLEALGLPAAAIATSEDLGAHKPSREFYDAVMHLAGVEDPSAVLYVGDRVDNDVLPAQAYGMRTCWLRRGPWGLLQDLPVDMAAEDGQTGEEEQPAPIVVPDLVLHGLGELPTLPADWAGQSTP